MNKEDFLEFENYYREKMTSYESIILIFCEFINYISLFFLSLGSENSSAAEKESFINEALRRYENFEISEAKEIRKNNPTLDYIVEE